MRHAILVSGPNASGKTTAVRTALQPWAQDPRLLTVYADNSDRKAFKGNQTEIEDRLLAIYDQDAPVLVVEGTNRIAMAFARVVRRSTTREWEAHVTQVEPWFLKWALQTRCTRLGKRFREDYWVDNVLAYETQRRFATINRGWLYERVRWWPVGAEYAGLEQLQAYLTDRITTALGTPQPAAAPIEPPAPTPANWMLF